MTQTTTKSSVGLRSERGPVLLAVMMCTALVAIDATILAAAVPAVVSDLGGFSQFPWLFSIYLLAQAVSVPIYGKLADGIGRKPVMLIGIDVATPHRIEPTRNSPMPTSMTGLRPMLSASLP